MIERKSPLAWPANEPRHEKRSKSLFNTSLHKTLTQLEDELRRFRASNIVLSIDAMRYGKIQDHAAALFFDLPGGRSIAICCDLYLKQDDNVRAIYKIVDGMRTIERFGGSNVSQKTFTGFAALPPPPDIWKTLGLNRVVGESLSTKMCREWISEGRPLRRQRYGHAHRGTRPSAPRIGSSVIGVRRPASSGFDHRPQRLHPRSSGMRTSVGRAQRLIT